MAGELNDLEEIKFGVFLPFYAFESAEVKHSAIFDMVRDVVLECERLGYDSVWLDDHLMFGKQPILECWTTLSALSALTSKIRLGTMVTCSSFRNPALLASEPRERIGRMKESVEIIKKLWIEEKASYRGKYYRINEAMCEPKPLQKPHPPITIGGSGEKLTLKVTAQHANRFDWGLVPSLKMYKHKLDTLESHCKNVGRDFHEIERSCWLGGRIFIAKNRKELDAQVMRWKQKKVSLEDFKKYSFITTPDECIQLIQQYMDVGVTYFMLFFGGLPDLSGLGLFAEAVVKMVQ